MNKWSSTKLSGVFKKNSIRGAIFLFFSTIFLFVSCAAYQRAPKLEDLLKEAQITDEEAGSGTVDSSIPMITVPTNGSSPIIFPTQAGDNVGSTMNHKFSMAQTEVTYKLWKTVYDWATASGGCQSSGKGCYTFAGVGIEGNDGTEGAAPTTAKNEPVTKVSWIDAILWCNAYTEWYNALKGGSLSVVFTKSGTPARDSSSLSGSNANGDTFDPTSNTSTGFRLPTSQEWEFAARLRKDSTNAVENDKPSGGITYPILIGGKDYWFTKGDSASGATANYNDAAATGKVAWYLGNSSNKTHDVATKTPNALGIYDMSGNVDEWLYDGSGSDRYYRGGAWRRRYSTLPVILIVAGPYRYTSSARVDHLGFRVVQTK